MGQQTVVELVPAPDFVAERLAGVGPGEMVHVRRRVTMLDGEPNQTADSYFSQPTAELSGALLTGEGGGGHIARIDAVSPVREVQEELTARMPTTAESARLSIPTGTPVVELLRSYHTDIGVLDVTHFVIRADLASFDYRFPIPD
ncbi:UTRA domain-containing protein [Spiractinospora alimapuensis]|uniref:UTRA domain-containing protein n=1 Tax=Spiractinospora alimapuensis TaxID=2820884 RepID=UPI001F1D0726|nr:UTRA domain-containing protein [Spiractinospora alimapuensis]QVQ50589.1 UTRA domain-containing protein [Spiractinospora alimapuensis]